MIGRSLKYSVGFVFLSVLLVWGQVDDDLGRGVWDLSQITVVKTRAEQGDPEAEHILGLKFLYGQEVPRDEQLAFEWIEKAAQQGYAPAQVDLGHLYVQGLGVTADKAEGFKWYLAAARQIKYVDKNQGDPRPIVLHSIKGRATGFPDERPMPGTGLALFSEAGHELVVVSAADDQGSFSFPDVSPGLYRVIAAYYPLCAANVPVRVTAGKVKRRELIVHMQPTGLDTCSWGDSR